MEDKRGRLFVLLTLFFLGLMVSRPAIALQYHTVSYPRVSANYLDEGKRQGLNYLGHVVDWLPADKEDRYAFIWEDGVMTDLRLFGVTEESIGACVIAEAWRLVDTFNNSPVLSLFCEYNRVSNIGSIRKMEESGRSFNNSGQVTGTSALISSDSHSYIRGNGWMTDHLAPHSTWHMYQSLYPNNLGQIIEPARYNGQDSNYILMPLPDFPHESAPPEPISEPTLERFTMLLVSILVLLLWWDSERNFPPQNLCCVRSSERS